MLPSISETQLAVIAVVLLFCGLGIGFVLGGLWMEQRLRRRHASQVKELLRSREEPSDRVGLSA